MQKKTLRKIAAVTCLSAAVVTLLPTASMAEAVAPVSYQQETGIAPYLLYIMDSRCTLGISGTTATVSCSVEGDSFDATKAKVVAELQVKSGSSWSSVATWTDTQYSEYASVKQTKSVTAGKTYRVKATVTVWESSLSETQTLYSVERTA